GEEIELTVESLAYGGQGVARLDGFVVLLEKGALPGSRVRARVFRRKKGFAQARVVEVLEESQETIEAPCQHFGVCGGCATQNLNYDEQLRQKQAQVADLFGRMGGYSDLEIRPIIGCGETYNYRNKMEFTFSNRAWVVDKDDIETAPDRALGLHVPGRYDKVLDIQECWLQHPIANGILKLAKARAWELGLKPWDVKEHTGFLRHLVIRVAQAHTDSPQVMVNLVTSREAPQSLKPLADDLVAAFPEVVSVVNNINTRPASVAFGEWEIVLHGKPTITEQLLGRNYDISANSFFQTNSRQAEVLYEQIIAACDLGGDEVVYDLFCGTGTIGITLAGQAREVAGFEMVESAVDDAARNALLNEVFNTRFFAADLGTRYFSIHSKRLQKQISPPDVVVIDPPRAGAHPRLIPEIVTLNPRKVVYVSCNPATQVRDVRLLADQGYRLSWAQPVDMFPHTPHIENICVLEKKT
ncbi:MAG: 23S rRNA (uracil(1939)-C(5))-methyltransferase RlmD, partial [Candidatus Neomarinimicrobiota bacterium]